MNTELKVEHERVDDIPLILTLANANFAETRRSNRAVVAKSK